SLTKQDFHLQRGSLGLQRGFSGYYLPYSLTGKLIVLHCFWFCNIFLSCYDISILIATIDATIDVLKLRATIKDYN
ncbi:hypothetical protein, partial [Agathobacter rectalis]|uniref:hypothetical protein n=1 Tax=Agathobacter rectalis TaxID=39491 RepID=UPI00321B586D